MQSFLTSLKLIDIARQVGHCRVLTPLAFALVVERSQSLKWHAAAVAVHRIFTADPQVVSRV